MKNALGLDHAELTKVRCEGRRERERVEKCETYGGILEKSNTQREELDGVLWKVESLVRCLPQVFTEWNKSELDSFLIEITANILAYKVR